MKRLSNEEKLELMLEYINKVGKKIVQGTIYKGYNLGAIKNNLRQSYYKGTLNMDEDLLQAFIESGIITKEKEKSKMPDQEKYDFLLSILERNPEERSNEKNANGLSYDNIRNLFQTKYNKGELHLSNEQIEFLISNGILHRTPDEVKSLKNSREKLLAYGIKLEEILDIEQKYGSFTKFAKQFKDGECDYQFKRAIFKGFRGITISSKDLTEEQKLSYAEFVINLFYLNEESIMHNSGLYIDVDEIYQIIESLNGTDFEILKMIYGIGCKKHTPTEIGKMYGMKPSNITYIRKRAEKTLGRAHGYEILRNRILKEPIQELIDAKNEHQELAHQVENVDKMIELIIDKDGTQKTCIDFEQMEELGINLEDFKSFFRVDVYSDRYNSKQKLRI